MFHAACRGRKQRIDGATCIKLKNAAAGVPLRKVRLALFSSSRRSSRHTAAKIVSICTPPPIYSITCLSLCPGLI